MVPKDLSSGDRRVAGEVPLPERPQQHPAIALPRVPAAAPKAGSKASPDSRSLQRGGFGSWQLFCSLPQLLLALTLVTSSSESHGTQRKGKGDPRAVGMGTEGAAGQNPEPRQRLRCAAKMVVLRTGRAMLPGACLHSCLSSQHCLDMMLMGGSAGAGSWESRDSEERKSFWDHSGMEKRSGAVGRRRAVALGIWAFAGEKSCLCLSPLQGVQPQVSLSPLAWISPRSEPGLVQRGSWVSRCSLAARKTSQRGWKTLPGWAAAWRGTACLGEQPACTVLARGGVRVQSPPFPLLGARLCFPFP